MLIKYTGKYVNIYFIMKITLYGGDVAVNRDYCVIYLLLVIFRPFFIFDYHVIVRPLNLQNWLVYIFGVDLCIFQYIVFL